MLLLKHLLTSWAILWKIHHLVTMVVSFSILNSWHVRYGEISRTCTADIKAILYVACRSSLIKQWRHTNGLIKQCRHTNGLIKQRLTRVRGIAALISLKITF